MTAHLDHLRAVLLGAVAEGRPAPIVLMRLLMEAECDAEARTALRNGMVFSTAQGDGNAFERLVAVEQLWMRTPEAWTAVRSTVADISHQHRAEAPHDTLRYWAETFDRLASRSPEASVALYSLGNAALLASATKEVVERMDAWGLLGIERDALDIGCGIGRFLSALSGRLRSIVGLDLSAVMITEAARRCAGLGNVRVARTTGRDLAMLEDESVDLVLAADVFPYVVEAGADLVRMTFTEIARVLRPGGHVLILNYSYRGDLDTDRRESRMEADRIGWTLHREGTFDLALWDAAAFLFESPRR